MNDFFNFKRQRELGEILTDTFKYIRLEYRSLFKTLLRNAGIPFLIILTAAGFYAAVVGDVNFFEMGSSGIFNLGSFFGAFAFLIIASVFFYALLFSSVLYHIKSYIANRGTVDQFEITQNIKKSFGGFIGLFLLVGVMLTVGLMLCVLPGIYLYVVLALVFPIYVFREMSVGDSISESFQLIKNEWWITFATFFVIVIIIAVISSVFQLPVIIYTVVKTLTVSQTGSNAEGLETDWIYVALNVLSSAVSYIFQVITIITSALVYFNLNEKKNQTGTLEEIENLGSDI
ncbi:MAG: hypothetical protein WBG71_14750 [Leeuwenhoekiella sp.]